MTGLGDSGIDVPKPPVNRLCAVCARTDYALWSGAEHSGVVSQTGVEHVGLEGGVTACGRDATGDGWWWPL